MRRIIFVLSLLLSFFPAIAFANPSSSVSIEVDFPYGLDNYFGIRMYEKGVAGSVTPYDSQGFPLPAQVTVKNHSSSTLFQLKLNFKVDSPLNFKQEENDPSHWIIEKLKPQETASKIIYLQPPKQEELSGRSQTCFFYYSGDGLEGEKPFTLNGKTSLEIRNPRTGWMPYWVLLNGSVGLALLLFFGGYRRLFSQYTTAEIVTLAILISFEVACSVFSQILRTFGAPTLILNVAWAFYFWIFLVAAVRLIPKKGTVLIFIFGGTLVSGLLLWGLSPIFFLTYTVCAALVFELWFRLTGFGKTLFSALGSAMVFLIYPVAFFWFYVSPILYHYFYHWWYVQLWLAADLLTYVPAAWVGYFFTSRLMKAVR